MKLYGFWRSLATYRVRVAFALKGLKAEEVSIDLLKDKQHGDDYLAVNPQGVVPALILDEPGPPLFQSLAILEYLEESGRRWPSADRSPGQELPGEGAQGRRVAPQPLARALDAQGA